MIGADTMDEVVGRLVERFGPEKIILFGSYETGGADAGSDVDLLVVAETDLAPRERAAAASRALADLPAAFDVFVKTPDGYRRRRHVVNHIVYFADKYGTVLYER